MRRLHQIVSTLHGQDITVASFTSSGNCFGSGASHMHIVYVNMSFDDVGRN